MIQEQAFDPQSGAPLTEERHYPGSYRIGVRTPIPHPLSNWTSSREGALTNGELRSAQQGLLGYFRRIHRLVREPDPALDRAAALALKRLKAGPNTIDALTWYALAEYLARQGYWVAWMLDHVNARCPHCASRVKFRPAVDRLEAVCASAPMDHGAVDEAIRERVAEMYEAAFDDTIEEFRVL
ncbi:hypothetical protein ACFPYI_01985 [Halomarina salina]|uniref:Uncharacterized protein n=1 Tax=Halomarina salina TaxID=1872699 RepID=A0ABD5RHL9_9EURY|nr:hypothetical protein [Halomarina salina]